MGVVPIPYDVVVYHHIKQKTRDELGPDRLRAAERRGATMPFDAAVELARIVLHAWPNHPKVASASPLSPREEELTALVAQGLTDVQISQRLFISVRTVRSHLDRIRDKLNPILLRRTRA